jgi:GT2 family glycosyltransferase/glycosyltransferase involved in cell wall biosynthesis
MDAPVRRLAVVIVTYSSSGVVGDCLRSLAVAGAGSARIIVVDNDSPDDTLERVAEAGPTAEVIRMGRNAGFAAGVNAGIAAAVGCDVLVANPDVRFAPGSISALRKALAVPGIGIAVPHLSDVDGETHPSLRRRPTVLRTLGDALLGGFRAGRFDALGEMIVDPAAYREPGTADWATGAAWLVSRDCVDAVGPLDERYFLYSEETEFMLRAGDHGFAVRYEPLARAVHIGGEMTTNSRLWALSATNKARLHRERHGRVSGALMRFAVGLNELVRGVLRGRTGGARHRAALADLIRMRPWPSTPDTPEPAPGYVCFSAQDWWYHNRAHSDFQLMRSVAVHRKVLVVNSIGMRMPTPGRSTQVTRRILRKLKSVAKLVRRPLPELPNFHVMSPLPLPFYGSATARRVNAVLVRAQVRLVCALLGLRRPVIMVTIPTAWDVVAPMRRRALVFNRSDRHSEFPEADRGTIEALEHELLTHADRVVYVSNALLDEERDRAGERGHFLDHGVDLEHFRRRPDAELPADLRAIPGPRVGFFGALDDYLVDFDLLERVAVELPDVSLVLIGDATVPMERLTKHPNVHWLGFRPYAEIPAYGSGFDIGIMPWLDNSWIRHANPIKLKEYLALGLPVVSTDFAELARYTDRVWVARDPAEFVAAIQQTLARGGLLAPDALRASVLGASWTSRAEELMSLAEERP